MLHIYIYSLNPIPVFGLNIMAVIKIASESRPLSQVGQLFTSSDFNEFFKKYTV